MSPNIENLRLRRIVTHYVYRQESGGGLIAPNYSTGLHRLSGPGLTELQMRITEAVGHRSHSVEVEVTDENAGGTPECCVNLLRANEAAFLDGSKQIADNLNAAQKHPSIGDSVLLVASGTTGVYNKPIVVLIKAEIQAGFSLVEDEGARRLQYLEDLFLTPGQKFYKVGVFFADHVAADGPARQPKDFEAVVYDQNLSRGHEIAHYFYGAFMGCDLAGTPKKMTKEFYEAVISYVEYSDLSPEQKVDVTDGLHAYLKSSSGLISSQEFERRHVPRVAQPEFALAMETSAVQATS